MSDDEKAQLYRTADVYVSPATGRESFGIVLLEAMAAGTAIVCSDIHGYKGVVHREEQALLVPPRDPPALAAALARLVADPALRQQMAESGRVRVRDFSWERVTAKVDAYYGFVIRRLEAQGALPPHYSSPIPLSPRSSEAGWAAEESAPDGRTDGALRATAIGAGATTVPAER